MSALTITRTFALLPNELPCKSYKEMTNLLVKERALKNRYTALMIADIRKFISFLQININKQISSSGV